MWGLGVQDFEVLSWRTAVFWEVYLGYSLNSFKGIIWGIIWGTTIGLIKGDTRSLDHGSPETHTQAPAFDP